LIDAEIERLEERKRQLLKDAVKEGVVEGIQKQSFLGGGAGGARFMLAGLGGGAGGLGGGFGAGAAPGGGSGASGGGNFAPGLPPGFDVPGVGRGPAVSRGRSVLPNVPSVREQTGGGVTGGGQSFTPISPAEFFGPGVDVSKLPAGMKNHNVGNIKYWGEKSHRLYDGVVGPSKNLDQSDPQIVFNSPQAGMRAAVQLARRKFAEGRRTVNALVAAPGGWTPGNYAAAANIARSMGVGPNEDVDLDTPAMMRRFMRGLITQEHGKAGRLYSDALIDEAIAGKGGAAGAPIEGIKDISGLASYNRGQMAGPPRAFIVHHTGGRGTPEGVIRELNRKGLGVQYVMDRNGRIYQTLPDGARGAHIMPGRGVGAGLSNANTIGMEVIGRDDRDITPAQVEAAKRFYAELQKRYPGINVFGHGEVNPGHKQATEGATITDALRNMPRAAASALPADRPGDAMMAAATRGMAAAAAASVSASGNVNVHLGPGLDKVPARVSTDGMFRSATVSRGKQMAMATDGQEDR
jgi:hypothetical protein